MSTEVSRRDFLRGAEAIVLAAVLNRTYAHLSAEEVAGDEGFWEMIRLAYVRDPKLLNLNNGGVAPAPAMVLDAEIEAIRYSNQLPTYRMWHDLEPRIEDVRKKLAGMWNADPECIAITRNASESLQIAQFGLELKPGDEVLTTSQDYPRMITTWQQRERREKIVLKQQDFAVPVNQPGELVRLFEQAITPRTRVIHVSHVVFMTGQIFPVKEICALARARGITSIVDGAHAFAHVPFQFSDFDCDYYGSSLHKWLSAPVGTGMLYVRKVNHAGARRDGLFEYAHQVAGIHYRSGKVQLLEHNLVPALTLLPRGDHPRIILAGGEDFVAGFKVKAKLRDLQ